MVGFPEQTTSARVDLRNGRFVKERGVDAGDGPVMLQVGFHILAVDAFDMASSMTPNRNTATRFFCSSVI